MRGCWNRQTGQLEVLVSYARMGSSPIPRTNGDQLPPTENDRVPEVSREESVG